MSNESEIRVAAPAAGETLLDEGTAAGPCAGCEWTRREVLKSMGLAGITLATASLMPGCNAEGPGPAPETPSMAAGDAGSRSAATAFDRYRQQWTWDKTVRATHNLNCGAQQNCLFQVYVKDGKVVREEQAGAYPQTNESLPDFNPRGCQKGCSYSELMYSAPRITKPLKRRGERGAGDWEEISWDQAIDEIGAKLASTMVEHGTDSVVCDLGSNIFSMNLVSAWIRFFVGGIDAVILDSGSEVGDEQQGAAVTYGEAAIGRTADDYFNADLLVIWGGNPAYTAIPYYHFITEARYNGTKVIGVSPDVSPSMIHSDWWIPIKPGTDAALALSMAKVIIDENLHKPAFLQEQTDLPCLVRLDNGKLLRESDCKAGGSAESLYRFDLASKRIRPLPVDSLDLRGQVPALDGVYDAETLQGTIKVTPVFSIVRGSLSAYEPEAAAQLCGVPADMIREFARTFASAKAACNIGTTMYGKWYHGDLAARTQLLVWALCGHIGRKGAGWDVAPYLFPSGLSDIFMNTQLVKDLRWPVLKKYGPRAVKQLFSKGTMSRFVQEAIYEVYADAHLTTTASLFWNIHGGVLETSSKTWDLKFKRPIKEYVQEAIDRNWTLLRPEPSKQPRFMFSLCGNFLRRVRQADKIRDILLPKVDTLVTLEVRMSSTAMYSDYVLPVAGAYESTWMVPGFSPGTFPFHTMSNQAVEPVGSAKSEWDIACLLARSLEKHAAAAGTPVFTSHRTGRERRFDELYSYLTLNGEIGEGNCVEWSKRLLEKTTNLSVRKWEDFKKESFARYTDLGSVPFAKHMATDIEPNEPIVALTWHTEKKQPWATLSGRMQFYIDHDWYLEAQEQIPVFKPPPRAGGDYPLFLTGGHTRWSIHSMQRTDPLLLRLQRGEPVLYVSVEDAMRRGIRDGDRVEVFNDVGKFRVHAKVSPAVQPGQTIIYHGWENFQFEGNMGYRNVTPSPIKPLELVGDYPFLKPILLIRQIGMSDRDTRVDFRRVGARSLGASA